MNNSTFQLNSIPIITEKFINNNFISYNKSLLQDNSRYQFVRDIHPDLRSGKHANHCFVVTNKTSMHESISLGKYFKELMQIKAPSMQPNCTG